MLSHSLEFLLDVQTLAGGWGYSTTSQGFIEPTAAAMLALNNSPQTYQAKQKAADLILSSQNPDGGWGICPQDDESGWQTAWAVYALSQFGLGKEACMKGVHWLLNLEVMQLTDSELLATGKDVAQINFSLRGFPWLPGEASWVEPTTLTVLAIKDYSLISGVEVRIDETVRYLIDRRCAGGGWNVGNPVMFGANLPARVTPTAMSLLALAKVAPHEILPEDVHVLRTEMFQDGGSIALAWGLWALHILGEEDVKARSILISRQLEDGSWDESPFITALSCIALGERVN